MTRGRKDRAGAGWLALLALPVVCCVGHAALLALAAGSLTAGAGAAAGSALLAAAGIALVAAAARRRAAAAPAPHVTVQRVAELQPLAVPNMTAPNRAYPEWPRSAARIRPLSAAIHTPA